MPDKQKPDAGGVKISDETRPLSSLKADPKNARRHPEQQIAKIAASIEQFGYVTPIVIRPDGTIIGGHATAEGLKRLGRDKVEVRVVAGLTPAQYQALGLALNKLPEGSSWDDGILGEVLSSLRDDGQDLGVLGFGDKELAGLLSGPEALEVQEIETGDVSDEFWISVRGPLADQAAALKALETVMKQFPGVSVDLGTIALGA